jgi:hypothetical protein
MSRYLRVGLHWVAHAEKSDAGYVTIMERPLGQYLY